MDRTSYMLAIPVDEHELEEPQLLVERITGMEGLEVFDTSRDNDKLLLEVVYNNTLYKVRLHPAEFELPRFFRTQHLFPDVDIAAIEARNAGLWVELEFADDALASYHLQLKLIDAMFSGILAVLDDSAEKILSGRWVSLAASSHVPPAPRYLYTVQAVSEEDETVWLHTHGLNRCNTTELEVLGSTRDNYESHYYVIETMTNRMLELEEPLEEKEPLFLARLSDQVLLVTTMLSWESAIHFYDEDILGGKADREEGHNQDTCCIFTYPSPEDLDQGRMAPLSIYDELLAENPVYMVSTKETERMKALAMERISYLKRMVGEENATILVKIGLMVDDENKADGNEREHIWFELKEISDLTLRAELTQEPYYISNLHKGHVGEYTIDMVTDWVVLMPDHKITPDDVYLLEM